MNTVDGGYKNAGYKNMTVIITLHRFTESFVFYPTEFVTDIKSVSIRRTLLHINIWKYPFNYSLNEVIRNLKYSLGQ